MGDAEYNIPPKQQTLESASLGLLQYIREYRISTGGLFNAQKDCEGLNWAFDSETRKGQEVSFSFGRAQFVIDGVMFGGETFGDDGGFGPSNGAKQTTGIFQRFDTIVVPDKLAGSGREIKIHEVCLVCSDNVARHLPEGKVSEIYYPLVNLGDEGISFQEEA